MTIFGRYMYIEEDNVSRKNSGALPCFVSKLSPFNGF